MTCLTGAAPQTVPTQRYPGGLIVKPRRNSFVIPNMNNKDRVRRLGERPQAQAAPKPKAPRRTIQNNRTNVPLAPKFAAHHWDESRGCVGNAASPLSARSHCDTELIWPQPVSSEAPTNWSRCNASPSVANGRAARPHCRFYAPAVILRHPVGTKFKSED